MKKVLAFALLVLLANAFAQAQTADEIIAKYIAATGGDNWKKVEAIRMEATITADAAPGMAIGWSMTAVRDKATRMEVSIMGMSQVMAAKGDKGWSTNPFTGSTDPEPMTADQVKNLLEQADIDGTVIGYKDKGYTVEYVGKEDVEGTEAHKIRVNKGGKKVEYLFYDPKTFYEIKSIQVDEVDGQEVEVASVYSNFKEVGGIIIPHTMQQVNPMMGATTITITKVEFNPLVDMKIFDMPAKK
ncbi:MAG: hypothetical protein RMJ33_13565 [Saprospiraceae bacterium]|nr:hypothetical protein [Saprospiraceae bacterium]MDW8230855.1 hypothetical protein [Saprospiraceae bacterium]